MKRFVSVIFIMLLTLSLLTTLGMSAFAAETPDGAGELTDNVTTGVGQFTKVLEGLLEQAKGFLPMEKLEAVKNEMVITVKAIWVFIQNDETYKNVFTAIAAILAFIFIPIIIGVLVVAYLIIAIMIVFAGVLVKIVEVILSILVGFLPF